MSIPAEIVNSPRFRWESHLAIGAAIPVLIALFIDLAFGRWGSYIKSPIPGIFLPDLLLALSCFLALPLLKNLKKIPKAVLVTSALCIVYSAIRGGIEVLSLRNNNQYLVLRDVAPFLFFGLIPIIAVPLSSVTWPSILRIARLATVIYLVISLGLALNLLAPFNASIIGNDNVQIFDNRGDLEGVLLGIGLLAWGSWMPALGASRWVQVVFLVAGFQVSSRSAFITFAFFLFASILRERARIDWRFAAKWTLASLLITAIIGTISWMSATSSPGQFDPMDEPKQQVRQEQQSQKPPTEFNIPIVEIQRQGTISARIDTYLQVITHLRLERNWIWGEGPGSDSLYEICTGVTSPAPATVLMLTDTAVIALPKCAVDDQDAPSTLRDPHNWILNLVLYHGVIGLIIFVLPLLLLSSRISGVRDLEIFTRLSVLGFLICGLFGVILSAPFALLPISVLMAGVYGIRK